MPYKSNLAKIYYVYRNEEGEVHVRELKINPASLLEMPDSYKHDVQELLPTAGEHHLASPVELLEVLVEMGNTSGRRHFQNVETFILSRTPELKEVFEKVKVKVSEETMSKIKTNFTTS